MVNSLAIRYLHRLLPGQVANKSKGHFADIFSDNLISNSVPQDRPKSAKKKSPPKQEPSPPPPAAKKDDKTSLSKLDDLPSLGGPASRKQNHNDFEDFGFEDDYDDSAGASSSNKKPTPKQPESKFSKAQKQLMDHDEEENSGYNMRMKAPGRQVKSNFEVYAEDIEEDI